MQTSAETKKGVSPAVGVVILVGLVVATGSIVGAFVSSQISNVEPEPRASVCYDQDVQDQVQEKYKVTVTLTRIGNSDYVLVGTRGNVGDLESTHIGDSEDDVERAPNQAKFTRPISDNNNGEILVNPGDTATALNLSAGDKVVVYAGIEGRTNIISEFEVLKSVEGAEQNRICY